MTTRRAIECTRAECYRPCCCRCCCCCTKGGGSPSPAAGAWVSPCGPACFWSPCRAGWAAGGPPPWAGPPPVVLFCFGGEQQGMPGERGSGEWGREWQSKSVGAWHRGHEGKGVRWGEGRRFPPRPLLFNLLVPPAPPPPPCLRSLPFPPFPPPPPPQRT
jgi:hypothetical protein